MASQTENGAAKVVGKVAGMEGYVFVIDSDGNRHLIETGEEIRLGQTLETLGGGAVVVTLANDKSFSLGQNQELTIDQRLIKLLEEIEEEGSLEEAINFDLIAQAIESGQSIDEILPATAAGGDNAPASSSSAGASAARIERTAGEVTPESGFDTEALINSTSDFNPPTTSDSFNQSEIAPVGNSRPVTFGIDDFTINEDEQYTLDLSQYFSDADADQSLTYSVENLPDGLALDPTTGIISGTPTNDSALLNGGAYSVVLTATDNSGSENGSATASFNLNVNNLNDTPTVESTVGIGSVSEDTPSEISFTDLLTGIQDIDGDSLSVTSITLERGEGVLSVNDSGNYIYTPSENWNGEVSFEYVVGDGQGGQVTNTATLNVTAVNDAPVAVNDGLVGMHINSSLTLDVLANDYDVDGDVLTITSASAVHGSVTINGDGTVTYTPSQDYLGRDVLSYTISDGNGGEAGSLALVNIVIGNLAPVMPDDMTVSVPENTLEVGNFAATDADGDTITYNLSGDDAALFTIDSSGTLSFVSLPDFETAPGPFSVTIAATDDGIGNLSDSQTLTVSVSDAPENTAPVLGADVAVEIVENTTVVGNFAAADAEGDDISYSLSGTDSALFNIDTVGNLSFIVAPDFETNPGPFNITVTATDDGESTLSNSQNITINISNVTENSAPVLGTDTTVDVAENATAVGNFAAADADGDSITYTLSGADAALFNIDAAGSLSFIAAPDFEASAGPFNVTVIATDGGEGTLFDSQDITVNVTNVIENTAPTFGVDTSVDVAENTTAVGNFAATDAEGDSLSYSLSGADAALFSIDAAGNLSFIAAPDYEANPGPFNITVTATDDGEGALNSSQDITVNLTNVIENTVPTLGADTSVDVAENTTAVGNFAATDADGDNITYSLSGADSALFDVDAAGNLSFIATPDFETDPGPFNVTVTATDDGEGTLFDSQDITVNVTNVIENTAPVLGANTAVDVAENITAVGNFAATEAEGDNISYSLSGADAALFSIDASGNLSFIAAPDFEVSPGPFTVTVTATDDGEGTLFDSQDITVNVTNVIENTAPTLGADTSIDVAENTTLVGNFAATDAEDNNITYSLSGADAALFTVDSSGNLSFLSAPDFEANPGPFNVTFTAADDGEGALSDSQDITVNVTNAIENTAPVLSADTTVDVAENSTAVGNFAATDAESDNVTYSLSGADAALFSIDAAGNLSFIAAPDFEANPGPFNVTVTAADDGEDTLSDSQDITVNVTNVIENTAPVLGGDATVDVVENATSVGNFAATDAENDNITYSLSGADSALFNIDTAGNLSFIVAPDFEANPGPFNVTVTATDDGEGTLLDSQDIIVNVTNVVENTAPVLGANATVDVAENTTTIGNFAATDADGDIVTYTLSGTDAALFSIDAAGNLSFLASPDFEADPGPFSVTVTATDDGEGTLFDSQDITVNLTNVIENAAPVLGVDATVDVAENTNVVGNFAATDADSDDITYSLNGADAALFSIDAAGNLSFIAAPDFEANPGPFNIAVTATDDGEGALSSSQDITVNVANVIENTAPTLGSDTSVDVAENTTSVGNFAPTDAEGDNITYSLSGADAALFAVDNSGNLSFLAAPDFDTSPGPFSVTITATDDGEGTLSDSQDITVNVTNVIENTAPVLGADATVDVAENTTFVGNFAATDAEDDNIIYSLSGADAVLFSIDTAGNLSFAAAPDFEANPGPFNVTVTAIDDGEGALSNSQNVTVNITNVIENTAPVLGADVSVDVAENITAVGNFAAADADGDNISYSLSGTDADLFSIDAAGNLNFVTAPDFEVNAGPFSVTVSATDDGEGTLVDSQNVMVTVTNVIENSAPVLGADATVDIAENTTAVGNFAATDAEGDNVTYSLSGANATLFSIDSAGNLSFVAAPDFEANSGPFNVAVTATDDGEGALSSSQNITVNVTNVIENTAPTLGEDTSVDVAENTTAVGNFTAADAEGNNITYSLSGADSALFTVDAGGNLSFLAAPDFEANPGPFNVTVTATDDGEGALNDSQDIIVNVTNVIENAAPVLGADTTVDIAENNTAVGSFAATDADGDIIIYTLSGADAALFSIDATGNLSFVAAPDFEVNPGPFNVTVTATDDGEGTLFDSQDITVNITNVIENTAPVLGADTAVDVAENTASVGNFAAADAEGNSIIYSLSGADAALFTVDASGSLFFLAAPDFETSPGPFNVTVTATDDGEGALSDSQDITVNVTNVIENTAPVLGADTTVDVSENSTVVGNFAASDTEGDNITYTLSGTDAALFNIDAAGNLSFVAAPDFETGPGPFNVTVTATDDGEGALGSSQDITVNVTNVIENTAPVLGADVLVDVAENTTSVGNFATTDAEGNNITYSLSGSDAALFSIDATGNLNFAAAPDFEANPGPFSVTVTATDDGEGTLLDSQNVTVNVTNVIENTAPVLGADATVDVAENTTDVGNFAATDAEGNNVTYSLSGTDAALFSIDAAGNLSFVVAPDFEASPGPFNVTVTATDDGEGTLFDSQDITVNVTNVIENTAPVLGADTTVDVAENTTSVDNFAATDAEGNNITYSLSGADAALFTVDNSGNLSFLVAPDFEANPGPFNVTITATDDGESTLSDSQDITISVTNVIENAAPVLGADTTVDVVENSTAVGNFAATDSDGDDVTYSLTGADSALFTINAAGNLSFIAAPDFEASPGPFNVTVTATDDGEGTLFDSQDITVNITNVIENTAPVLGADTTVDVAENTTSVGNFASADAEGNSITYSLSGADSALFTVDAGGNLSFLAAPDFETSPGPFNVTVTATDDGEGALSDSQDVTVNVTNVIENTAPVLGADTTVDVPENSTVVGNFTASDTEGDNITYSLSGADSALFNIDAAGNLSFIAAPDFEASPGPFNVTVTATDDGEGTLFDSQDITVNVTNVIENTAPVLSADITVDIAENSTAVGNFAAMDAEGDNLSYSLSGTDAALFNIDAAGNLRFVAAPDFEANPGPFNVTVTAIDDGEGALSDSQNVTVNVTNVIENTAPVLGADVSVDVAENITAVGNFAATDADDDNISYSLSGTDAALFGIDAAGNLSFVAAPDYEANPGPFNVIVTATDDGEDALSNSQDITVNVTNVIENTAPTLGADTSVDVAENTMSVGNFAAADADGDSITYTLSGADAVLFNIDTAGNLSFVVAPDFEASPGPFNVTVTATDDGEGALFASQNITVNVTNVIENTTPVLGVDATVDVAENTTAVGNFAATDADGDIITYTLSGTDAALFSIDAAGNLSFIAAPDFEIDPGPFNVTVTATDDGEGTLFDTQDITVNVTNVIENTAPVLGADVSVNVAENTTSVGNFAATDAEGNNITYTLSGSDAALFGIDATGNLNFATTPDFEANPGPFNVTVTATDNGEGTLSDSQDITVNVTNAIENTAPVLDADAVVDVAENTTAVGNFAAIDAEGDNITYSVSGGDATLFTIDNSGNLSFLSAPDFESNAGPFNVTVTATDDGEGMLFDSQNIIVNVTNVIENTAPVLGGDATVDVAENTTVVGNFAATDAEGDNIAYSLSGADSALFNIDAAGNLNFIAAPDFEANPGPFSVTVTATDNGEGALANSQDIIVNVTNVIENTAPVLGADTVVDVAENSTLVGNFAATDAEGDSVTYTLSGTDAGLFAIDSSGNLSFVSAPDFEMNAGPFSVRVTATDDGEDTLFDSQDVTVNVTNVIENTAPVLGTDVSVDVAENTSLVGNFAATDAENDNITYVLSGTDAALFSVDTGGNLSFISAPDFETNAGPFNVTVTATDDGEGTLADSQDITVNVTNMIENTAPVLGADATVDVAENTVAVGSFAATDAESDNITYSLSGTDAALFSIDAAGNLSFIAAPDYEANAGPFNITVTASDDGEGALSSFQDITVNVTNVIENTAPTLGADTSVDVTENTTSVGNFAATDAEGNNITYSLSGPDAAFFTIDNSGNLSFLAAPDFEDNPGPFNVTVTATDDGEGALSDSQDITVNVTNVIENTAPVLGADTTVDVAENSTAVGNFAATDADGDVITYTLSGTDAALFNIDAAGNLSFVAAPDYEANPGPFNITVTAIDDGEGTLFDSQDLTVNVTNVIENTAPVLGADTTIDIAENATAVGNFAATDADADSITYTLSGDDAALFDIDAAGNLVFISTPDFEVNPGPFTLTITATDDGEGLLSDSQNITVNITNVIENTAPVLGADTTVDVAENTTSVGSFAATDAEGNNITYNLSGANANLFTIDAAGNLSFMVAPDFEVNSGPFNVTVTATDDGEGTLFDNQAVTVNVTNINEPALLDLDTNNSTASGGNYQTTYTEGGSAVRLADVDISITDVDSTQLQSANITITNVEVGDLLSAGTLPTGISASAYNPTTGTITLTGSASLAAYQTAIRAIQFSNDGSASGSSRNIEVTVNDGSDDSNVATTTINMVLVPTVSITDVSVQEPSSGATTLVFTISIDQTLAGDLTFSYNTADVSATGGADYIGVAGGAGTIIAGATSTTISITVNSDANNFEGDETFAVNLSGFNQTVNFPSDAHDIAGGVQGIGTIGANNGAPEAVNDSFITSEGTSLITGNVFSNDSLVDNADYASHNAMSAEDGTVTYNGDGTFTYTPTSGFSGTDSFTYSVIDDDGETDTATVTVEVTDVPVNPPVVASVPDTVYTENDSPQSLLSGITLSDIDSTTLSSVVVRIDGYIASQDALDYLTAGTSVNASVAASGNTWELTLTGGVDINEYLSVLGSLTYENLSENPSTAGRTITVEAYDEDYNNLFDSDSGTITVIAENDAPTVSDNDTFYVSNSVNNSLNITAPFDVDTDNATLVITVTSLPSSVGTVTLSDGSPINTGDTLTLAQLTSLQLDASAAEGMDSFTYTVFDGELTTVGTTTINVGDSEPDVNTVYESALDDGTGINGGSVVATGNLFSNDAAADGSTTLDSIEHNSTNYAPISGVITIGTALGTLTVYADNSNPGFKAGDYEYVLNSADGSGANINENFTYNFTSGVSIQDTLTVTVVDDQPIANDLVEDIPESEEQVFNLVFTLDISTSMNAEVGSTGLSRLDLAKQSLVALAREYFDQSTHVSLTVLLFANGAHVLGSYDNFTDAEQAIIGVTDNSQTAYSNDLGWGNLSDSTSYNDALDLIEQQLTADLASQNPADEVRNISYFLSDGAITADGSPVGSGFDGFVNSNSIDSYSVGIGTGLPGDLTDLNFIHNIDSLGQGNGHVDNALIVSDVSLLESELLSTVPTAFGGNITVDGSIANVEFGADGGFVSSISLELGGTLYSFTYNGSVITVPGVLMNIDVDGSKITFNDDDGFAFGTFTFDFSDGTYLFIAPNGAAGSTFNFDFTVLDGDGDGASATATINIVDDRPDARDDLHTVDIFETAQGNVVTGIGTDGGPKLGTGFTEFAVQGGGVDKVVDNATVTEFTFRGETISLDLTPIAYVSGQSADVSPTSQAIINASDFTISASRSGSPATLGFSGNGVGVQGTTGQGSEIEVGEVIQLAWDSSVLPNGVQNLILDMTSFGGGDTAQIRIYDTDGGEMPGSPFSQNGNNDTLDLSAFNGIGSIEITSTSGNGFTLNNIAYDPVLSTPVETGGTNGANLTWTYQVDFDLDGNQVNQATITDSNNGSTFIMRSNGYYEYTPETLVIPPGTPVSESFADGSADQGITPSTTDNGNPVITFNPAVDYDGIVSIGVSSTGDQYSDSADRGDNIILTFDSSLYPDGVQEIQMEFGYSLGAGSAIFYDDQGEVIDTVTLTGSTIQTFSGISGVRSMEITTGPGGDYSIRQVNFEIVPDITALSNTNEPILVDYVLTDSDGQSDTAQLAIHTTDNQITGTVGADSISSGSMNDAIFGDDGDDILSGGAGHDTISGGAGIDIISGNADSDYLSGGDNNDEIYGGAGNDHLAGDAGNDLLDGGLGDDIAIGGEGNDLIFGGAGNDRLEGGAGDDAVYGGAGNDLLFGDDGDDIIFGGTGDDTLTGGDNIDTFVWQVTDAGSMDTITDFESGLYGDVLDFSDLLQGESADAITLDTYFTITSDGTDTTLEIDIDGDSSGIDMTVVLQGVDLTYLSSEQQILQQLLDDGNLVTD